MKTAKTSLILLAFIMLAALPARAADSRPVIIELFTAQTCSSCPPADALVKTLSEEDPGMIVLACHVDYFDSEHWKDKMAQPFCNDRHAAYEQSVPLRMIATPTIVVNGKYGMPGAREKLVRDGITAARATDTMVDVTISKRDEILDITLPAAKLDNPVDIIFVGFSNPQTVNIGGGENEGETIDYTHPVLYINKLFTWNGAYKTTSIPLKAWPASGYAILVQERNIGPIIGAAITD